MGKRAWPGSKTGTMTSIAPRIGAVLEMEEEEMMIVAMRTGVGRRAARDIADAGDDGPEHDDPESLMQQLTNPRDLDPLLIWKEFACTTCQHQGGVWHDG